ncbi:MAG: DUF2723 domain-containing protein [Muribaculaceae bacterium]|nr:DUF2723 domain-containing protein [Muribaculaceae bacterium]
MIFTRKYNLVNNLMGWGVFVIALITYWLTLEPTASYWDCGEFIIQADKLEIGHPPGNPIFMLTARFFSNFAFGDPMKVAVMVNAMSGLLSALTILLLFWTITHLVRRLLIKDSDASAEPSLVKYMAIMGSGLCGALAYAWSDTFWFSAVEGEVYAFSSFCTALVFWLILKWENRADQPHSDRYLILIAYVIGVSVAVHLLNLLCIPAIVLVYCYRRFPAMNVKKSLLALLVSFAIVVLVLYGLVPGFIKVAGWFELLFVNSLGLSFNSGTLIYTILAVGVLLWALYELYAQRSADRIRISFMCAVFLSGILFIGSSLWLGMVLFCVLAFFIFYRFKKNLPVRWLNLVMWSIFVIFVGYSSYALILIRSNAATPMNQNSPDNVFDLSSYLNREQYGQTPLLYGQTYKSSPQQMTALSADGEEIFRTRVLKGKPQYARGVKGAKINSPEDFLSGEEIQRDAELAARGSDYYAMYDYANEYVMNPELDMLLPRIHSSAPGHEAAYALWADLSDMPQIPIEAYDSSTRTMIPLPSAEISYNEMGEPYQPQQTSPRPTFGQSLEYFFNYQLNHMYWRYFLWNFAGRQNDINNQYGEKDAGNWISGIPFIDDARLGDQSLLPDEYGKGNKGHNVFYMLPLLLGIIGLLWQAFRGKRGIEQFWVVFFLFFMTGIAIVLYLNQPPLQPRERDYAYAGSFYAFAIWIGIGVAALWCLLTRLFAKKTPEQIEEAVPAVADDCRKSRLAAFIAVAVGVLVPLQMVSQTWDDHDRSGRYAARDYAVNYLESLEPNAIIFCNGDNDTFPLWYAQEVEGVRPDVKIINLSYLSSDWYANQQRLQTYTAPPVKFTAQPKDYAYHQRDVSYITPLTNMTDTVTLLDALKKMYADNTPDPTYRVPVVSYRNTVIPVDKAKAAARGLAPAQGAGALLDEIPVGLGNMSLGQMLMLDIIATNAANGWERPIYWAMTVGEENYRQFLPYLRSTGMALQLVPYEAQLSADTKRGYDIVTRKYRWGGADVKPGDYVPYFDETAGRMLSGVRMTMLDVARQLTLEKQYDKAAKILDIFMKRVAMPVRPLGFNDTYSLGTIYCTIGQEAGKPEMTRKGLKILADGMKRYAQNVRYVDMLAEKYGIHEYQDQQTGVVKMQLDVMTTPENQAILYTYYPLIEAYETYAGAGSADAILRKCGISAQVRQRLKQYYDKSETPQLGADSEYAQEIAKRAEIVVELQGKTPEEYAAVTDLEKQVDSTFVLMLQDYLSGGGSQEELLQYEIIDKVNSERSLRVAEEYAAAHGGE